MTTAVTRTEVGRATSPAVAVHRPNVLVFVADDQDAGHGDAADHADRLPVHGGGWESLPNFTVADPLCCPSRASIMTGRFNHNNHVYSNDKRSPLNIDLRSTIQCYLQEAGYRTGFYGKFLNGFPITYHQPCLTDYAIAGGQAHDGRPVSVNGTMCGPAAGWTSTTSAGRHASSTPASRTTASPGISTSPTPTRTRPTCRDPNTISTSRRHPARWARRQRNRHLRQATLRPGPRRDQSRPDADPGERTEDGRNC